MSGSFLLIFSILIYKNTGIEYYLANNQCSYSQKKGGGGIIVLHLRHG